MERKKPLYRKVNTRTHRVWHNTGSEAKYDRNTKEGLQKSMKKHIKHGLDFSPLYMFLLSKVGCKWDEVYSEAKSRLPIGETDAINHLLRENKYIEHWGYCRAGENSLYSTLYVDENGLLQKTHPDLHIESLYPSCGCCTHTFNGKPLTNKWLDNPLFKKNTDGII